MFKMALALGMGLAVTLPAGVMQSEPMSPGKTAEKVSGSVNRTKSQVERQAQGAAKRATGSPATGSSGSTMTKPGGSTASGSANRIVTGSPESRSNINRGTAPAMNRSKTTHTPPR
jgi:hypothetical protein